MSSKSLTYDSDDQAYSVVLVKKQRKNGGSGNQYQNLRRNMSKSYDPFTRTNSVTHHDYFASPKSRTTPPPNAVPLPPSTWITSSPPPPFIAMNSVDSLFLHHNRRKSSLSDSGSDWSSDIDDTSSIISSNSSDLTPVTSRCISDYCDIPAGPRASEWWKQSPCDVSSLSPGGLAMKIDFAS